MLAENPARPSPGSHSANAIRTRLLRSRILRGRLTGLGQDDSGTSLFGPLDTLEQTDPFASTGELSSVLGESSESQIELLPSENIATADLASSLDMPVIPGSAAGINQFIGQTAATSPAAIPTSSLSSLASAVNAIFGGSSTTAKSGTTKASTTSSILSGSTAEYLVFGGIGLILVVAMSKRR